MEYKILKVTSTTIGLAIMDMEQLVNEFIEKGWIPCGSVQVPDYGYNAMLLQPMIKME